MARLTKALIKQLDYVRRMTKWGGATMIGCGNGDFNRYNRMIELGFATFHEGTSNLVITAQGREILDFLKGK